MSQSDRPGKAATPLGGKGDRVLDQRLLQVVDIALAGCIFVVPLLMGGRHPLGQLVLVGLAVTAALAWTVRQVLQPRFQWRLSRAEWLLCAGAALLLLQLAPLPQSILAYAAPKTGQLLPLWTGRDAQPAGLGSWSSISLTPSATRAALAIYAAYALLFLVALQRLGTLQDVERLLSWIALSVVIMAGFGLVQLLAGNGKFFWFYEHPFTDTQRVAKGSFTNRNHFAHFLALGVGPLIWWLQHNLGGPGRSSAAGFGWKTAASRGTKRLSEYGVVALGIVLFAALLSLSRGGVAVMFLAAAITVAVCYRVKALGPRFVLSLATAAVMIGGLLAIHGYEKVANRLDDLGSCSLAVLDNQAGRRTIWAAVVEAIPDYALLGSGAGSHVEVYPMYLQEAFGTEYTHAENGPLQVLLETGTVGLMLLVVGVGFCAAWCIGGLRTADSPRMAVCIGAIAASLAASVVHSLGDFVWYVPACTALVALLAAAACRLWQMSGEASGKPARPLRLPKFAAGSAILLLAAAATWMIAGRIGPAIAQPYWDRYRIIELADLHDDTRTAESPEDVSARRPDEVALAAVDRVIGQLERVVYYDPDNGRAHLRLAAACLRRFDLAQQGAENAMPLAQIRDAARQARAGAADETERREVELWLSKTLGSHRQQLLMALEHARQGLALCPLQGEGYLYLAELRFIEGPEPENARGEYFDQALRVRPYDGAVLFELGREAWLAGDRELWFDYWRRSFRSGPKHRRRLIEQLAAYVPVEFIVQAFPLDLQGARILYRRCEELNDPEKLAEAARYRARLARAEAEKLDGRRALDTYLEAVWLYNRLHEWENALACAEGAKRSDPNNCKARRALIQCLIRQQRYAEAEEHLKWCLRRRGHDEQLQKLIQEVIEKQIAQEQQSTAVRAQQPPRRR